MRDQEPSFRCSPFQGRRRERKKTWIMRGENLTICLDCQTLAEECFKEALSYFKVREAFGKRIGDFQHNDFKLAQMATETELGRNYPNVFVREFINAEGITLKVSMAKAWVGEMAQRIAYNVFQLRGGYGYMEEGFVASFGIFAGLRSLEGRLKS
jgi:acyl-CoA dehydrogenase